MSFRGLSGCSVTAFQLFLCRVELLHLTVFSMAHLQGEVPEHSAPGGGHAQTLVPTYLCAACVGLFQHHCLHRSLPPRLFGFRPATQTQRSAAYSSEGELPFHVRRSFICPIFTSFKNKPCFPFLEAEAQLDGRRVPRTVPCSLQVPSSQFRGEGGAWWDGGARPPIAGFRSSARCGWQQPAKSGRAQKGQWGRRTRHSVKIQSRSQL